jgi:threonine dehydrogenase-like Zn-dependent dehydrogenase
MKKMKAIKLFLDWNPRKDFKLGLRDIKGRRAQSGNQIWKNPQTEKVTTPIPEIKPTEALIKVKACGICGSDILMPWQDEQGYTRYPYIMGNPRTPGEIIIGHEFSGEIVKMGQGIKDFQKKTGKEIFKIGTPVVAQCVISCGLCEMCKEGKFDCCLVNEERGFSVDGAMAEYAVADIRELYSLENLKAKFASDKEMFLAAALIEPLAGVYKALINVAGGLLPGENAVVIGGGPMGLSAVALLKAMGASKVILIEISKERLLLGKKIGATHFINPNESDVYEAVLQLTNGSGAKIYFEAAGIASRIWPEIDKLFQKGEPESKFILFGHGPGEMNVSHETLIGAYSSLVGSHGHSGVWRNIIRLIEGGVVEPHKMITQEITLEETPKWLEILQTNKEQGKVVITF